jgi:hypothetical protein
MLFDMLCHMLMQNFVSCGLEKVHFSARLEKVCFMNNCSCYLSDIREEVDGP